MENISSHLDRGKALELAILDGVDEVGGAVVYSVLTTVAAFAPIPFACVGVSQRIFSPICAAVIVSQGASLLVGFTLVPALIAILFPRRGPAPGWVRALIIRRDVVWAPLKAFLSARGLSPSRMAAWKAEIHRRIEEIKSGKVEGIPAEEVFRRMREKYG